MIHTYTNKDGRVRAYNTETQKVTSYPRILMEQQIGRPLEKHEHVHHKDENPLNNDLSNLELVNMNEHIRNHVIIYKDEWMICTGCGEEFFWTSEQQRMFHGNCNRKGPNRHKVGPFCSRSCSGKCHALVREHNRNRKD